jgi:hypothetical protein
MMNEKLNDKVVKILTAYIGISWLLAFLLFCYEFILGPFVGLSLPLENASTATVLKQEINYINAGPFDWTSLPIPLNQFIAEELILVIPSSILFGSLYHEATKENHDD